MTFQISQRGKQYVKAAQTLLRAAQNMTDRAIAGQLRALADDYQRRADNVSHVAAAKALVRRRAIITGSDSIDSTSEESQMRKQRPEDIERYDQPATGWDD